MTDTQTHGQTPVILYSVPRYAYSNGTDKNEVFLSRSVFCYLYENH